MPALKTYYITLSLSLLLPSALYAQPASDTPPATPSATLSTDIVITALRTPVPHDAVSASVTVLDQPAIAAAQPIALTDLLARTPSISIARNGGYGAITGLTLRGAGTDQTVVVIDGMRVADATAPAGNIDIAQLFTDDTARIEILRGPQAILWGSDAIGGIINITTAVSPKPLAEDFSVEAGSHATLDAHAGIGGTSTRVDWRLSGSDFTTAGIPSLAGGTLANGYARQAASATATLRLARDVSLDLRGYWDGARSSYSDDSSLPSGIYAGDYTLAKQWTAYAGLNVALAGGRWQNRLAILENATDREDYTPIATPALTFVGHGRIRRYEYQASLDATGWAKLLFGAERAEARMVSGSPYDLPAPFDLTPHNASTDSLYAEARIMPAKGLTLNGGVRYDHHPAYGGHGVASAGGAYTPDAGTTLIRASYDQGFKAPSLYQLYGDYGNPALRPATARGWNVGAERHLGKALSLAATWWERSTKKLINFADCPYPLPTSGAPPACYRDFGQGYYVNIDAAEARGLELAASANLGRLTARGNYSLVSSQNRTPGALAYGAQLPRVPRHLANLNIAYAWLGGITTSVALRTASSSLDTYYSPVSFADLPVVNRAYAVVDARAEAKLAAGLTLFGRVENLGNRHYQTVYGYNSLGRAAYLGLRARL